jgi:hypothetical protein
MVETWATVSASDHDQVESRRVERSDLASDFITKRELPALLRAAKHEGARLVWIAVTASLYKETPLSEFQAANDPDKPLDSMKTSTLNMELVRICEDTKASCDFVVGISCRVPLVDWSKIANFLGPE